MIFVAPELAVFIGARGTLPERKETKKNRMSHAIKWCSVVGTIVSNRIKVAAFVFVCLVPFEFANITGQVATRCFEFNVFPLNRW